MSRRPRGGPRQDRPERVSESPEYVAYLRSTQWREKRKRLIAARGGCCEVCGWFGPKLSLHHLTYVRLYDELDSDLLVTCEACHAGFHGRWGVVRGVGASRLEKATRLAVDGWKERARVARTRSEPTPAESNEWQGYDPFADASQPCAWNAKPTPSLKDRF